MNIIKNIRRHQAASLVLGAALIAAVQATPVVALTPRTLVKGSGPAVYYLSQDNVRHVFPSQAVFDSWYPEGTTIAAVADADLAAFPLGSNVTFRPGSMLIKITTDPKVYAVSRFGTIHWVTSEALAADLYGAQWNRLVADVPDTFFTDYTEGTPIASAQDYGRQSELDTASSPQADFGPVQGTQDPWMTPDQKRRATQITSVLENDTTVLQYGYVENLDDGRGLTMGRAGFTTANGDALLVVQRYASLVPDNALATYLPRLKSLADAESDSTSGLEGLPAAWEAASHDPLFRQAQDEIADELYYVPAMNEADTIGIATPLGRAILFDAIIQHGGGTGPDSLSALIDRTRIAENGTPATGIDEIAWLYAFLRVRRADLLNASDPATRDAWAQSADRVDVWEQILDSGNMTLSGPIKIDTSSYQAMID